MGIGRIIGVTAIVLAGATGVGCVYLGWDDMSALVVREQILPGVRKPLFLDERSSAARTSTVAVSPDLLDQSASVELATAVDPAPVGALGPTRSNAIDGATAPAAEPHSQLSALDTPAKAAAAPGEGRDVMPMREGRSTPAPGEQGIVILQIGDNHTSADFLTGELRQRLQARYGRGAPGYVTAGHPHIGVRSSTLKITASSGWSYTSLQKTDAVPADFWLSGYNATATAPGETMTFVSDRPVDFEAIEIEVLRQPGGGKIDVRLDGVAETSYDLASSKPEPVAIRLLPTRAATERVREIAITTSGRGPVTLASVAIYNKRSGLTFNSVGYPGAQASFLNKFNNRLLANDLTRINPQIVILSFGTNEAANESLDLMGYRNGYERIVDRIRTTLPEARIVVIGPPDVAELPAACRKDKAAQAACGRAAADSDGTSGDCAWRTPPKLHQVREVQREIAERQGLVYWNWASIMPSECGAHRWYLASPQLMAKDHVHFTIEGYKKSADQFLDALIPVIEQVRAGASVISNN